MSDPDSYTEALIPDIPECECTQRESTNKQLIKARIKPLGWDLNPRWQVSL